MIRIEDLTKPANLLALQLTAAHIVFKREVMPLPGRRFRADFLLSGSDHSSPNHWWIEVDGGTWAREGAKRCRYCGQTPLGRHSTGSGRERDTEKLNLAVLAGFRVLVVSSTQVRSGKALAWIKTALKRPAK